MNLFQCSEALLVIHYKVKLVPCVFWQALNFSSKTKIDKKEVFAQMRCASSMKLSFHLAYNHVKLA